MQESLSELKNTLIRYVTNPLYIGLFILFLLSSTSSAYILFAFQKQAPANTQPETLLTLPTLMPTPTFPVPTNTPSPTLAAIPTPTPATVGWLTYTNTTYGYSLNYPTDWTLSDEGMLEPLIPSYIVLNPASADPSIKTITISYTMRTPDELSAIYGDSGSQMTIASYSATEYQTTDSDGNQAVSVIMHVGINSIIFFAVEQYQDTLMQMLDTFQLTD